MSQASSISARRRYGLQRVCRTWRVARSTMYFQRQDDCDSSEALPRKRGPMGPCDDEQLVSYIRRVLETSPFHGEGHRKVWAKLRAQSIRTSKPRVLRLMREHGLLAPQRVGRPHGPKAHDGTIISELPDQMWGTDMTTTVTLNEGTAAVFIAVDHCTCECVGIHASKSGNRFEALEPIRQGVSQRFGVMDAKVATGLSVRHDHGSAYMSDDFQGELKFLGITSSPSFVREPEGNGCAERFIRVLKENLLWVRSFETIEQLREALLSFKDQYNTQWLIERHGYQTPAAYRQSKIAA